jgi:DNA (cytosine-5)-methyltransferase 1
MRHGSLFSGIGGFDLAAEWMGWENVFHCEWNPFGQRVLHHYWPNAETFTDITKADFTKYYGTIDIITGGFPCQPYSSAGKRLGKEDERHLWPQMLRAIREIKPKYIVGENVFGLLNWNGGMVFDEVHSDLEFEGYEVQAVVIPAAAVNAPHGRDRVWFVATNTNTKQRKWEKGGFQSEFVNGSQNATDTNGGTTGSPRTSGETESDRCQNNDEPSRRRESSELDSRLYEFPRDASDTNGDGFNKRNGNNEKQPSKRGLNAQCNIDKGDGNGNTTDADSTGRRENNRQGKSGLNDKKSAPNNWDNFPTQSPICGGDDGLPTELDGVTFSKWRAESIKAYGNAIVPQVAYQIFKALELCK